MTTIIKPDEVFADIVDNVVIIGFVQSDRYFIVQREGSAGDVHVELDDQSNSCYDGLLEIVIEDNKICFQLNSTGKVKLNTDWVEIIGEHLDDSVFKRVKDQVNIINRCLKNK